MSRELAVKKTPQIPDEINELWGRPPVLDTESSEVYNRLAGEIAKAVEPRDIIEWLWVKDILDLFWEVRRLRQFKADFIQFKTVDHNAPAFFYNTPPSYDERREEAQEMRIFIENVRTIEKIDGMVAFAESRRNAVLREIEGRRASLASRLRKLGDIIDGEFSEPAARGAAAE